MEGRKCDAVVAAASSPPWMNLPRDVTANILQRLGEEELLRSALLVCSSWWRISKDPALWRVLIFSNPDKQNWLYDYDLMCRCAVDRSMRACWSTCTVQYHGFDINYISQSDWSLLYLSRIRHSKSLPSLNCEFVPLEGDEYESLEFYRNLCALAISVSMPNLQHLQLFAHWIEDEGLEDILDGCPHLESLDVRQCFVLLLEGDLEKRCRQTIKHLKLPNDPVSDSDVPWPNCDGCNMFGVDAYSEVYVYKYYEDSEAYHREYEEDEFSD
ncbi:putative F-box/LRR-repeat protein 23 [Salvia hispanica]|uniref:putative F-box/LRR-repeat protein 23 n=1 Tax=Salvia hispanica TaxID=49212 RepID=UPI002009632A|nr:putative F-box/LRR-repeat protein 23 [Salvia hispanica]